MIVMQLWTSVKRIPVTQVPYQTIESLEYKYKTSVIITYVPDKAY